MIFARNDRCRVSQSFIARFRDGESAIDGFLDDYAFTILAFLDLYETRFEAGAPQ